MIFPRPLRSFPWYFFGLLHVFYGTENGTSGNDYYDEVTIEQVEVPVSKAAAEQTLTL